MYVPGFSNLFVLVKQNHTVLQMFTQVSFWAGNQDNYQKFYPPLLPKKLWLIFMIHDPKWPTLKKLRFSTLPILSIFSRKILGLVLGSVWYIDAQGNNMAQPTYRIVMLYDVRSKTGKNTQKSIFCMENMKMFWVSPRNPTRNANWKWGQFSKV